MQISDETKKGEGSLKGVKMIWPTFNLKSPLGSLTEEYGNHKNRKSWKNAYRILPSNSPGGFSNWKLTISFLTPSNSPPPFWFCQKLALKWAKKHNLILLCRFCLYLSSIDAVQLSLNHCFTKMMVSSRVAMVRFLLKLLLVKSGQQDGALLFCVARVKKKGGGVFRGRGVNRKNTVIHYHL